jgi:hypothetical protein
MTDHIGANHGCLLVGEYVDESEIPPDSTFHIGEVIRPHVVSSYLDLGGGDEEVKEFTVLLKDDRMVSVRGHGLKLFPPTVPGEGGSYGVIVHAAGEEVLVALFRTLEVVGIFSGEIGPDRKIA